MDKSIFELSAKWQLRLFLLFAPGILAEILSGNTPILKLANPVDLFFLVLAYGVAVSLIWEYKVQKHLSLFSVFLLGLAYGLVNEWLLAKTILDTSSVPMWWFVDTTDYFGINWSWFFMIIPWHAFFSVLFPITLAHVIFPEMKNTTLYGKKWNITFLLLTFIFLPLLALTWQWNISLPIYIFLYGSIFSLAILARLSSFQSEVQPKNSVWLRWGLLLLVFYLFQFIGAGKMPLFLYILISLFFLWFFLKKFLTLDEKHQSKFALWAYLSFWFFALLATLSAGRVDLLIMYIILNGGIYICLKKKGYF